MRGVCSRHVLRSAVVFRTKARRDKIPAGFFAVAAEVQPFCFRRRATPNSPARPAAMSAYVLGSGTT